MEEQGCCRPKTWLFIAHPVPPCIGGYPMKILAEFLDGNMRHPWSFLFARPGGAGWGPILLLTKALCEVHSGSAPTGGDDVGSFCRGTTWVSYFIFGVTFGHVWFVVCEIGYFDWVHTILQSLL